MAAAPASASRRSGWCAPRRPRRGELRPRSCALEGIAALSAKHPVRPRALLSEQTRRCTHGRTRKTDHRHRRRNWRSGGCPGASAPRLQGRRSTNAHRRFARSGQGWSSRPMRAAPCAISASTPPSRPCPARCRSSTPATTGRARSSGRTATSRSSNGRAWEFCRSIARDLHALLMEAVRANDPAALWPGHEFVGLDQDAAGVSVTFANGARRRADVVIGADGNTSAVRSLLFPGEAPRFNGQVAFRALIPDELVPDVIRQRQLAMHPAPRRYLLHYPLRRRADHESHRLRADGLLAGGGLGDPGDQRGVRGTLFGFRARAAGADPQHPAGRAVQVGAARSRTLEDVDAGARHHAGRRRPSHDAVPGPGRVHGAGGRAAAGPRLRRRRDDRRSLEPLREQRARRAAPTCSSGHARREWRCRIRRARAGPRSIAACTTTILLAVPV